MAVHLFNDSTLKKSTAVGLQAFLITICMFLCQWFILSSKDFKCQLFQASSSKETLQLIRGSTLTTCIEKHKYGNIKEFSYIITLNLILIKYYY